MNRLLFLSLLFLTSLIIFSSCSCNPGPVSGEESYTLPDRPANTVVVRLEVEPDRLNPMISTTAYGRQVYEQIFQYLIREDPQTFELIPILIKSIPDPVEINSGPDAGGTSYSFELLQEAAWSNGTPVSARDYVFSIKATLNPRVLAQRYRPFLAFIKDIRVDEVNPKKFTVITKSAYVLNLEAICAAVPVLPAYLYDPENLLTDIPFSDFADADKIAQMAESDERLQRFAEAFNSAKYANEVGSVSGSGPYELEKWETGQELVLRKKADWWGNPLAERYPGLQAYPEMVVYKIIPDAATAITALKAGEVDVMDNILPASFNELLENEIAKRDFNFHNPPELKEFFLYINNAHPWLGDKRVRRALAHAINVDDLLNQLYEGFGTRIPGPVLPVVDYYNADLALIELDREKAAGLLADAGWTDTNNNGIVDKEIDGALTEMKLQYLSSQREISQNMALLLQNNLKDLGIDMDIVTQEPNLIFQSLRAGEYDLSGGGLSLPSTLWDPMQNWHTESIGAGNYSRFGHAESDALIEKIRITLDPEARTEMYKQLQAMIYEEQPCIFYFSPQARLVIHKRFDTQATSIYPGYLVNTFKLKQLNI